MIPRRILFEEARSAYQISLSNFEEELFFHLEQFSSKIENWSQIEELINLLEQTYSISLMKKKEKIEILANLWANGKQSNKDETEKANCYKQRVGKAF